MQHMYTRWAHDNWPAFERFADQLGLPPHTCVRRPSTYTNRSTLRCEQQHVATTAFVLHLVCNASAHAKGQVARDAAKVFLTGLFQRFFGQVDFHVAISLDIDAFCWPGKDPHVEGSIEIPIDKGMIAVSPLLESRMPAHSRKKLVGLMKGEHDTCPMEMPLHMFCILLFRGGKSLAWLTRQFIIVVAMAMDTLLDELGLPSKFPDAGGKLVAGRRPDHEVQEDLLDEYGGQSKATMEKLGKQLGLKMSWAPRAQRRMLAKYVLASRRQTQDVPRISIAMDASRLGGKDCLCGVVICTSAVDKIVRAAWSPPQAFTKTHF